jgi:hypothetical protein
MASPQSLMPVLRLIPVNTKVPKNPAIAQVADTPILVFQLKGTAQYRQRPAIIAPTTPAMVPSTVILLRVTLRAMRLLPQRRETAYWMTSATCVITTIMFIALIVYQGHGGWYVADAVNR